MAEVEQGQAEATAPSTPFVALGEGDAPLVEPNDEATAEEAGATPEPADANAEISAEEPDPNDPEALRKKYNAQYSRKLEAERKLIREQVLAELQGKVPEKAPEPEPEQPPPAATSDEDPIAQFYKVEPDSLKIEPTTLAEDHQLYGFEKDLDEIIDRRVDQKVQRVLESVYKNDRNFREQQVQGERTAKARTVIESYVAEIKDHPDVQEKAEQLNALAQRYKQLAIDDPELFVEIVERKTGLERGWRGDAQAEQTRTGQQNKRLATKPLAQVPRPTRASVASPESGGNMTLRAATDKAMRARGLI